MRLCILGFASLCVLACDGPGGDMDAATAPDAGRDGSAIDATSADTGPRDASIDAGPGDAGPADAGPGRGCPRTLAPADGPRHVVVSHPYDVGGGQANAYEVLSLGTDGTLSRPGTSFMMGRAVIGRIAFTPDGEIGLVAQTDGSLGVFRLDASGAPTVVHANYSGAFYAAAVVMDPSGSAAWVIDSQFRRSGGGVYRVQIACDGSLFEETLVAPAQLPYGLAFRDGANAYLFAKDVLDTSSGPDLHLLDVEARRVVSSADIFSDPDWIGAAIEVTANGRHVLVGDNSFLSADHRVAVAAVDGTTITRVQEVTGIRDPNSIVASPFDDAVLVVSGVDSDRLFQIPYTPGAALPLGTPTEVAYMGGRPELPSNAILIDRGALEGLVLVAENLGVRRLRFEGGGVLTDLGVFTFGPGLVNVAGAMGVAP